MVEAMIRCDACDRYFPSKEALEQHLRDSPAHAPTFDCDDCDRSFSSDEALQQHLRDSPAHAPTFDCDDCDRRFSSDEALQQHLRDSPAHVPTFDYGELKWGFKRNENLGQLQRSTKTHKTSKADEILPDKANSVGQYNGVAASLIKPVYRIALHLRRKRPSIQDIVRATKTSLELPIVAALWNAAERLNSLHESPEDAQLRAARQMQRSEQAKLAEDTFVEGLSARGLIFTRELDQRSAAEALKERANLTPDVKFTSPVVICGTKCCWLEFKDYFGFPDNPFVAQSERRQFRKYVTALGPGAVVYSLGFQCGYPNIDGVGVFRAREILQSIAME